MLLDLAHIQTQLKGQTAISRFAPSVTGYLHLGHLVNAVYVWGVTRALGGKVLLRLEDHDRGRFRPDFEARIFEVLHQLRLVFDNADAFGQDLSDFRQSDCKAHYIAAEALFADSQFLYNCTCSRKIIMERAGAPAPGEELRYDGFCLDRGIADGVAASRRLALPDTPVPFVDLLLGPQTQTPARQCGDLSLADRQGNYTYQFCVVVDDLRHDVNLVIRGVDLLASTGRQIMLGRMLGAASPPLFLHHPLLVDAQGRKLSKRDWDAPVYEMLDAGNSPEELLGKAAFLAGLSGQEVPISAEDLPALFA